MDIWGLFMNMRFVVIIFTGLKYYQPFFALIITVFSFVKILSPLVYESILICIRLWIPCSILKTTKINMKIVCKKTARWSFCYCILKTSFCRFYCNRATVSRNPHVIIQRINIWYYQNDCQWKWIYLCWFCKNINRIKWFNW